MNVALVDDSLTDRQALYDNIRQYCQEHKVHMQVSMFENGTTFLSALQKTSYNLVFLDIYIGREDGMRVAQKLRRHDPNCQIIFITSSAEHAVKAFQVQALDYLVKPYSYERFEETMKRCESAFSRMVHYIELKEGRGYTRILIPDILYVDYYNHYIQVHTKEKIIRSYMSFSDFVPALKDYPQFLCCYRNCMVNMDYIESMDGKDFIIITGERLPISKGKKNEIIQAYADYIFDYVNGGTVL